MGSETVLLEWSHEGSLLFVCLEATVSELGGGVDPFDVDLLGSGTFGMGDEGLTKGEDTLLGSDTTTLEHNEVVLHFTIMRETTLKR